MKRTVLDTRREDWATRLLVALGLMTVMAAAAAFIVAGVYTADTFATRLKPSELARNHGVAAATAAWAMPLALTGIAALFSGIAIAFARIRINIRGRRDALVGSLARVLQPTT
jgi:beta-lactamase regulating signal transducer with metallopeptidase domain